MTRCLDCGAERTSDQCTACGLTSAAAEVMLRRRLLKRTAAFLVGSLLFPYVIQIFPPLDMDLMLVFFGVLFFVGLALAVIVDRRARQRKEVEALKRIFAGFVPLPWILLAILFLNGRLDSPKNIVYHSATVDARFSMKGIVKGSRRLIVPSWRTPGAWEHLAVDADDFDRFKDGDEIQVATEPGALGIPWLYGVYRRGSPGENQ